MWSTPCSPIRFQNYFGNLKFVKNFTELFPQHRLVFWLLADFGEICSPITNPIPSTSKLIGFPKIIFYLLSVLLPAPLYYFILLGVSFQPSAAEHWLFLCADPALPEYDHEQCDVGHAQLNPTDYKN